MKKEFMEPEMRRIELNLKESIADGSDLQDGYVSFGVRTSQTMPGSCTEYIWDTTYAVPSSDFELLQTLVGHYNYFVQQRCYSGQLSVNTLQIQLGNY